MNRFFLTFLFYRILSRQRVMVRLHKGIARPSNPVQMMSHQQSCHGGDERMESQLQTTVDNPLDQCHGGARPGVLRRHDAQYRLLLMVLTALISGGDLLLTQAKPRPGNAPGWVTIEFREPLIQRYSIKASHLEGNHSDSPDTELIGRFGHPDGPLVSFSSRLFLETLEPPDTKALLREHYLTPVRQLSERLFIFQAPSALHAVRTALCLTTEPGTVACAPVMRRALKKRGRLAPLTNDTYLEHVWHIDNRDPHGHRTGIDLGTRRAWSLTRGEQVVVAVSDNGIDLDHPELAQRAAGMPHFNFGRNRPEGGFISADAHGTAVAGLIAAEGDNQTGVIGVAPRSQVSSWVVFEPSRGEKEVIVSNERLMDMFEFRTDRIDIQNHSWGNVSDQQAAMDTLSDRGIETALRRGRGGKGIVMFRAAGNDREFLRDANDDAYSGDPRSIAVAALRADGNVATYSSRGACILIAAPSGDDEFAGVATTDHQGKAGFVTRGRGDLADYLLGDHAFAGTSAAAPLAAGVGALILSSNPNLHYRDVQQILIHAARQTGDLDPDVSENGAGFSFSHNTGFGLPDAGFAVELAQAWPNRPELAEVIQTKRPNRTIPDAGYELHLTGKNIPGALKTIPGLPSLGIVPLVSTDPVALVFLGDGSLPLPSNLQGKAAVFRQGPVAVRDLIRQAAAAGAHFVVISSRRSFPQLPDLIETDFTPIPAIGISQRQGSTLINWLNTQADPRGSLRLRSAIVGFEISDTLICEHVGLQLSTTHPYRGDLRITLTSPMGSTSILQAYNHDSTPGPRGWTYWSTHHFYESSAGTWTLRITDQQPEDLGSITSASLILRGVRNLDIDRDGLDDQWERSSFGSLIFGPKADPDHDGYNNAREQVLHTDPTRNQTPFRMNLSLWNPDRIRIGWPSQEGRRYEILHHQPMGTRPSVVGTVAGRFPESEFLLLLQPQGHQVFSIRATPQNNHAFNH